MIAKRIVLSIVGVLIAGTSAQAQQVGTYKGTTEDGSSVTITVAHDPNNENLEVKVIAFGVSLLCEKSKETLNYIGIGLGDGYDIVGGNFSYATSGFFDIDLVTNMTFRGMRFVKGKVGVNFAAFDPAIGHPTLTSNVQVCVSPRQPFTATFSGPQDRLGLAAGTMTVHTATGSVTRTLPVRP
jgi:hypothetical protein